MGCTHSVKWAEDIELKLQCDMDMNTVTSLSDLEISELEYARDWNTHVIYNGRTELRLGFVDGQLKWTQVAWPEKIMKIASYAVIDLCGVDDSRGPNMIHRLPNNRK